MLHFSSKGQVRFLILMLAVVWAPVALHASPGCFSDGRIVGSGTWPIQSDGYHHVKVQLGTQDGLMLDAISAAITAWNLKAGQTKVHFDQIDGTTDGPPDLVFHHGDTTVSRFGQSDDCAFETEDTNDPSAPAEIWFNDGSGGVVDAAHDLDNTSDLVIIQRLIEHEVGHFLLMQNGGHQDSSTIMTTYDPNLAGDCEDKLFDAQYPTTLDNDANNVVNCLKNKTYDLDGGGDNGDGDGIRGQREDHPGLCEDVWAVPTYSITTSYSVDGEGKFHVTVTYTQTGYTYFDMGSIECDENLPQF